MTCFHCGKDKKCYPTFGKLVCSDCIDERRTGRKGHSGMIYKPSVQPADYSMPWLSDMELCLSRVKKSHPLYVKWYIEHYPGSKGIVGRQINYLIYHFGRPVGIIGVSSPPLHYKKFEHYFKLSGMKPSESSKLFLNNNVFRLVDKVGENLGTRILKLLRRRVKQDYNDIYGQELIGLVTFVERPRTGAVYKADNWEFLGETEGIEVKRRGKDWLNKTYLKTDNKKLIFAKVLK